MEEELKKELSEYIDSCQKHGLIHVCEKIKTQPGKDWVISRLDEMMDMYPTWKPIQCLGQIEIELSDMANY